MARSFICGFAIGDRGEEFANSPIYLPSVYLWSAGIDRSLIAFMNAGTSSGEQWFAYRSMSAGGTLRSSFLSVRFIMLVIDLVNLNNPVEVWANYDVGTGSIKERLRLNTDGTLTLFDSAGANGITSTSTVSANQESWTTVEIDLGWSGGAGRKLRMNGKEEGSSAATAATASTGFKVGCGIVTQPANGNCTIRISNILYDDSSFTSSGYPGRSHVARVIPTADPASLNSWTNGGGGTTSIFEGVNNIPPTGAAASTNGIKIKNAANGGSLDYVATMQTYLAAGVPVGSKINAVMAICNDGEEVATNTKAGGIWIASNPAQTAGGNSFDYGDDAGALGTFPTNWATHCGPVASNPTVTLSTAPTVTVRKTSSTTRVVDVDFLGMYVDYTPPNPLSVISQPTQAHYHQVIQV